jgi:hypothetical protein
MDTEFETLFSFAKKLRSRYLNTLSAFKIFNRISELTAPNIVGEQTAEKNLQIFNAHRYFFITTKEANRCYFFIELAKFFDTSKDSLTILKVINYAKGNIAKLTKEDLLAYHSGRVFSPDLFAQYRQLSLADLEKFSKRLDANSNLIERLKTYRDECLAHDDIKKSKVVISAGEIEALLGIVRDIIELLFNKLDFSMNSYTNFEKEPIKDLNTVIDNLIEFEENKLKEDAEKRAKLAQ